MEILNEDGATNIQIRDNIDKLSVCIEQAGN